MKKKHVEEKGESTVSGTFSILLSLKKKGVNFVKVIEKEIYACKKETLLEG
jgi:hypothetical protein